MVNTLTLKGRIAKEVDIYVAQIIVQAILDDLDYAEVTALLSAFVCDYKPRPGRNQESDVVSPIPPKTTYSRKLTKAIGKTLYTIQEMARCQE